MLKIAGIATVFGLLASIALTPARAHQTINVTKTAEPLAANTSSLISIQVAVVPNPLPKKPKRKAVLPTPLPKPVVPTPLPKGKE